MSKKRNPVNIPGSQSGYLEGYTPGLWGGQMKQRQIEAY